MGRHSCLLIAKTASDRLSLPPKGRLVAQRAQTPRPCSLSLRLFYITISHYQQTHQSTHRLPSIIQINSFEYFAVDLHWTLLSVLLLPTVAFATAPPQPARNDIIRIIGGVDAQEGGFLYIVSLQLPGFGNVCGGSLLDATTVLTAVLCVHVVPDIDYEAADLRVRVGSWLRSCPYAET